MAEGQQRMAFQFHHVLLKVAEPKFKEIPENDAVVDDGVHRTKILEPLQDFAMKSSFQDRVIVSLAF